MKKTKRQSQVLGLIQKGFSNKVIAKHLNITEATVKAHVGALLKIYGVKNRTQLGIFSNVNKKPVLPNLEAQPTCWIQTTANKITAVVFTLPKTIGEWLPLYKKK